MPSIGIPNSNIALSHKGELSPYTLFGPPVKIIPFGFISLIFSTLKL